MTVYWNDADIPGMMADSPNVITATPDVGPVVSDHCLLMESDELKLDAPGAAGSVMRLVRVYVQTSLFGFLEGGKTCNVDGVNYQVWKSLLEGDGAVTQLLLRVV